MSASSAIESVRQNVWIYGTAVEYTSPRVNLKLLIMPGLTLMCIYGNLACRFVGEAYEAVTDGIFETLWKEPLAKSLTWMKAKRT
jgi:hypothetical protein